MSDEVNKLLLDEACWLSRECSVEAVRYQRRTPGWEFDRFLQLNQRFAKLMGRLNPATAAAFRAVVPGIHSKVVLDMMEVPNG